jgi:hypothetical protein
MALSSILLKEHSASGRVAEASPTCISSTDMGECSRCLRCARGIPFHTCASTGGRSTLITVLTGDGCCMACVFIGYTVCVRGVRSTFVRFLTNLSMRKDGSFREAVVFIEVVSKACQSVQTSQAVWVWASLRPRSNTRVVDLNNVFREKLNRRPSSPPSGCFQRGVSKAERAKSWSQNKLTM